AFPSRNATQRQEQLMFKVMTWNVENLFKPGTPSGPPTQSAYDAKLQGLAATINDEAPDALALQEIGDPAALDDLVQRLQGNWNRRVSLHPDQAQRPIRVAWLSRRPITDSADIVEFPPHLQPVQVDDDGASIDAMGRGAVAITVVSDSGKSIRLVTAHLKSKLLTFPGNRFQPHDEDERARFGAYALYRRAAGAGKVPGGGLAGVGGGGGKPARNFSGGPHHPPPPPPPPPPFSSPPAPHH